MTVLKYIENKKMTILNTKLVNPNNQPLFLGEDLALVRFDKPRYPTFINQFNDQFEALWRPEEIEIKKDKSDFRGLSEHEKFIFLSNLKYQTMMDSVIARGVPSVTQYVTNTELEQCLGIWEFFERIHAKSYSYLIENVFADPTEVFDSVLEDKMILERAEKAAKAYDDLNKKFKSNKDLKKQIYLTLAHINVLEGIRFYVSFACALAFEQRGLMAGNARIIRLIKTDEAKHIYITQSILKILREVESEGFVETAKECEDEVRKIFIDAANEEKEWASYLFKDGGLIGLNEAIAHQYIEWLTDIRMVGVGLKKHFGTKNPISWLELDSEKRQVAPQESESTSYKIGAFTTEVDDFDLEI